MKLNERFNKKYLKFLLDSNSNVPKIKNKFKIICKVRKILKFNYFDLCIIFVTKKM